jgi:hypothetical protein
MIGENIESGIYAPVSYCLLVSIAHCLTHYPARRTLNQKAFVENSPPLLSSPRLYNPFIGLPLTWYSKINELTENTPHRLPSISFFYKPSHALKRNQAFLNDSFHLFHHKIFLQLFFTCCGF